LTVFADVDFFELVVLDDDLPAVLFADEQPAATSAASATAINVLTATPLS
jgi:hypothetical protein